ncbi:MAG: 23S rRNA (pseudouridine(1915)-N(3))-methyltransferase RlmH [Chitinispirillaceae bacterium]
MNIKIASVGKIKDRCISEKIREYERRIRHDAKLETVEIRDSGTRVEGAKLQQIMLRDEADTVVLSEEGKLYSSKEFSALLGSLGPRILFVIGGPDGLEPDVKKNSEVILSLSRMTFTHEMARLFLLEQIFRAISIRKNRKYHRD